MIKFSGGNSSDDMEYYKGVFIDLGCPWVYAMILAKGHLGITPLTGFDTHIKNLMLQGYPYATAKSMAEDERGWR